MNALYTILTFVGMECVTWVTHKYVMHGFLWRLHEDHHQKDHKSFFEKNDLFFVIFAIPSIVLFASGAFFPKLDFLFFIGLGIFFYGMAYFLIHDIFIHQRFKWFRKSDNVYFRALRRAHKVHHKHLEKEEGECFGMLWVPLKYYKISAKQK